MVKKYPPPSSTPHVGGGGAQLVEGSKGVKCVQIDLKKFYGIIAQWNSHSLSLFLAPQNYTLYIKNYNKEFLFLSQIRC